MNMCYSDRFALIFETTAIQIEQCMCLNHRTQLVIAPTTDNSAAFRKQDSVSKGETSLSLYFPLLALPTTTPPHRRSFPSHHRLMPCRPYRLLCLLVLFVGVVVADRYEIDDAVAHELPNGTGDGVRYQPPESSSGSSALSFIFSWIVALIILRAAGIVIGILWTPGVRRYCLEMKDLYFSNQTYATIKERALARFTNRRSSTNRLRRNRSRSSFGSLGSLVELMNRDDDTEIGDGDASSAYGSSAGDVDDEVSHSVASAYAEDSAASSSTGISSLLLDTTSNASRSTARRQHRRQRDEEEGQSYQHDNCSEATSLAGSSNVNTTMRRIPSNDRTGIDARNKASFANDACKRYPSEDARVVKNGGIQYHQLASQKHVTSIQRQRGDRSIGSKSVNSVLERREQHNLQKHGLIDKVKARQRGVVYQRNQPQDGLRKDSGVLLNNYLKKHEQRSFKEETLSRPDETSMTEIDLKSTGTSLLSMFLSREVPKSR